ncbi:MAG: ferritin-like domain-containing protein [Rhodothermales bacterium]
MNPIKTDTPTATASDLLSDVLTEEASLENTRRAALRSLGKVGLGLAFASAPATLFASAARAQSNPRTVSDVLLFALTLEYLERNFYNTALDSKTLSMPDDVRAFYEIVADHESDHVDFLIAQIAGDQNPAPPDPPVPDFDFTAGGTLDPFNDYPTFLLLSQAFEDTGVRAYKGQVPFLIDASAVLTAALGIHSVEARHASKVRRLRGSQGWIPFDESPAPAVAAVYAGMNQTVKYNIDVPAVSGIGAEQVTEAWDEPLTTEEVLNIVAPFIVGDNPLTGRNRR